MLSGFNLRNWIDSVGWLLHVLWWEIAEGGVLRFGQQLVVCELPRLAGGFGKDLLEVVFNQHARGVVNLGHSVLDVTHLLG